MYRYSFPSVSGDTAFAEGVNTFFSDYLEDAAAFTVPINGESIESTDEVSTTDISSTVTCNTDSAFSVLVRSHSIMDGYEYESYSAILEENETDTWLQDRQTAKADKCVRDIIWEQIEQNSEGRTYLPDISYDLFQDMFFPEEDFYLDETGNPVFFVQPGILTPEEDGVLLFPVSLEFILDEI